MRKRELIFQAFNWQISAVRDNLENIANQNFSAIQLSPLQQHKEPDNPTWYLAYQPTNFKVGNRLGNRDELKALCEEAKKYDIIIVVDVVLNHMGNDGRNELELIPSREIDSYILNNKEFWHKPFRINNFDNRFECSQGSIGLPDLNTSNHKLQDIMIEYLNDLISLGVEGLRFDACRHIEMEDEGKFSSDFWNRVLRSLHNRENLFLYGEVIYSETELIDKYGRYFNVGVNNGKGSDKKKLVQWVLSHDDVLTFGVSNDKNWNVIMDEWEWLLSSNKESHMLWYPSEETWRTDRFREINFKNR